MVFNFFFLLLLPSHNLCLSSWLVLRASLVSGFTYSYMPLSLHSFLLHFVGHIVVIKDVEPKAPDIPGCECAGSHFAMKQGDVIVYGSV